uniref:Reverse transcriptase domain-containing protein n=1 Tax=Leptobrachium leishanense TaxID=445787 RepID=A0A8C5LYI8_9ANUR
MSLPHDLSIMSINARGLNLPEKRSQALRDFRNCKASVVFIQETHLRGDTHPKLTDAHYPTGFYSNHPTSKSKGTALLFHKHIPFISKESLTDGEGRLLVVKGHIANTLYTFANLYAPNRAQHRFIATCLRKVMGFTEGTLIMGGDFNVPLSPLVDTSKGTASHPSHILRSIGRTLHTHRLVDCWRATHPEGRDYTFFSRPQQSYSRLDYFFMQHYHLHTLKAATIGTATWSDHAPIHITLTSQLYRPASFSWRLNDSFLANDSLIEDGEKVLETYFTENATPDVSDAVIWEAHKCVIRGHYIKKGAELKKKRATQISDLVRQISDTECLHKRDTDPAHLATLTTMRRSLSDLMNTLHHRTCLQTKAFFHTHGDKSGRLLARMIAKKRAATYIACVRDRKGRPQYMPPQIMTALRDYYKQLYSLPGPQTDKTRQTLLEQIQTYHSKHTTRKLSEIDAALLEEPITEGELSIALKSSQTGKSPGPDGLPLRYYKTFRTVLVPHFLKAFNALTRGETLPPQALMANITLLPKEGKDLTNCANYRPISLLNADVKLFAKVLATRLQPHIPNLIHCDQVGFVPGREAKDNTIRALQLIHEGQLSGRDFLLLSTDSEKAFDRVNWDFLFASLAHIGLGPQMQSWVKALYTDPSARICVNGVYSESFPIQNGTRQGCPLSPLLFVLSLEPFLSAVRQHPDITGPVIGTTQHKIAAYADDLLFFVTNPRVSLPCILSTFKDYGVLSNLKINFGKSNILSIQTTDTQYPSHLQQFPFPISHTKLKYLGIWLNVNPVENYRDNFAPLLTTLQKDLSTWNYTHISWLGRVAIIKMNLLPRLLYLFQTIPISLPKQFFSTLKSALIKYIWRGGTPRLRFDMLTRRKSQGGLAVPDFRRYHIASHLLRILDWSKSGVRKKWKDAEQGALKVPLAALPWLPPAQDKHHDITSPYTLATMAIWRLASKTFSLSTFPSPLLPIVHNRDFALGLQAGIFCTLFSTEIPRVLHMLRNNSYIPLSELYNARPPPFLLSFKYGQLRHFLRTIPQQHKLVRQLTGFEQQCMMPNPVAHGISYIYSLLQTAAADTPAPFMGRWEMMLGMPLTEPQWDKILDLTHHCSIASKVQEAAYKVLTLWYRVPTQINQMFPDIPPICWRCNEEEGTMLHIWWSCRIVEPFWRTIHAVTSEFVDPPIPFCPASMLLHHTSISTRTYKRSVLVRILNVAKSVVPLYWKQIVCPSLKVWRSRMEDLHALEQLIFHSTDQTELYTTIWSRWTLVTSTTSFKTIMSTHRE